MSDAKKYLLTRVTKTHVWIIRAGFGRQRQRGLSMRVPIAEFHAKWERLPQKEVRRRIEAVSLGGGGGVLVGTDQAKYKRLKDQIHAGVMLAREDFLFVKGIDQRSNAQGALARDRRPKFIGGPVVYGGYNTVKR